MLILEYTRIIKNINYRIGISKIPILRRGELNYIVLNIQKHKNQWI